jgi:FkbM family methyltransferase
MARGHRKLAFVLAATDHGPMILNRFDYHAPNANTVYGVGIELLQQGAFSPGEIALSLGLLDLRRRYFGDGVVAIDCGANIGVHTVEWAKHMTGWGSVTAFEAQERVFYALAGNIALNNCFNARAINAAVAARDGTMKIPSPDYLRPGSFGSLELKQRETTEFIGQPVDYSPANLVEVPATSIDSLTVSRIDMIKIDVEGMELEVLEGATRSIERHQPVLMIEWVKSNKTKLASWLTDRSFVLFETGMNFLAIHKSDRCSAHMGKAGLSMTI